MKRFLILVSLMLIAPVAQAEIAVYRGGYLFIDSNNDHILNDSPSTFGQPGDKPFVVSSVAPTGDACALGFGVVRDPNTWFITTNDFSWDSEDQMFTMGNGPDPLYFNSRPTSFEGGKWIDGSTVIALFGQSGDYPVAGAFFGSQVQLKGVYRPGGMWYFDSNISGRYEFTDAQFSFGGSFQDQPVVGDFNPSHPGDEIAIFRDGQWLVDFNGNFAWDGTAGGDQIFNFGQAGDTPLFLHLCVPSRGH